jgi:hypothetical protein
LLALALLLLLLPLCCRLTAMPRMMVSECVQRHSICTLVQQVHAERRLAVLPM